MQSLRNASKSRRHAINRSQVQTLEDHIMTDATPNRKRKLESESESGSGSVPDCENDSETAKKKCRTTISPISASNSSDSIAPKAIEVAPKAVYRIKN